MQGEDFFIFEAGAIQIFFTCKCYSYETSRNWVDE